MNRLKRMVILVITVLFIGGIAASCGLKNKTPEEQVAWVAHQIEDELELNATQQQKLQVLADKALVTLKAYRQQGRKQHAMMRAMLEQPSLNRGQVMALIEERNHFIAMHSPELVDAVADLYDTLNSEQRAVVQDYLAEFIERRERYWN